MTSEEYLVTQAKINREMENLLALEQELRNYGVYPTISSTTIGSFSLEDAAAARIIGSILHDYYTAVEKIFETVASRIDKSIPTGDQWHKELLDQMALAIPGVRPPVISPQTARRLDPYRGFRHVFRNVYGFNLSTRRMIDLLRDLPATSQALQEDLDRFASEMRIINGLEKEDN